MKKSPIIFIAMLIALAFTSCQMNTDDSVVTPPAPTTEATSYKVVYGDQELKTDLTLAQVNAYITQISLVETTDYSIDKVKGVLTLTESGYNKLNSYLETNGEPTTTEPTDTNNGGEDNNNGGNGTGEAEETSVTIPNVNVYIETHENGLGLNDGKKHGSFKLSKEGNTVTITVLPETGYELGYVLTKDTYGNVKLMNKNGEPITTEAESPIRIRATYNNNGSTEAHNLSITEASNGVYTFEMLDNVIVNLKARFDPIAGYTVESNNLPIAKGKTASATSTENISVKPGNYFTVDWKSKSDVASLTIGGKDYSDFLKTSLTNISLLMPAHDVAVTTTLKKQQ